LKKCVFLQCSVQIAFPNNPRFNGLWFALLNPCQSPVLKTVFFSPNLIGETAHFKKAFFRGKMGFTG
jgi:hypothetical protein